MVTQITLGNLFSSGGKNVISGGNSGLDTESLIKSLVEAKQLPATKLEDRIDLNGKKSEALSKMRQLLSTFKDAANFLRNPPGVGNASDNIFAYRSASVSSNTSVAAASYLSVTVEPGTTPATYLIDNITQIATAKKQETDPFVIANQDTQVVFAAAGPGQFQAGTVTVNGVNITLNDGDTLRTVAKKFNDTASQTGISAQVFQTVPGQFKLIFTATETGTTADFDLTPGSATVPLDPSGVFTNINFNLTQGAQNAFFDVDGVTIQRETNHVDDLVEGITFNLLSDTTAAPLTQLTVQVEPDAGLVKDGVINFVNAYNEFKLFLSRQSAVGSDGRPTEDAVLFSDNTARSIASQVNTELARAVSGIAGTDPSRLSELGITFSNFPGDDETPFTRNILTVDEAKLTSAIQTDFDAVRKVFEFDLSSNSTNLQVFKRTNGLGVNAFSLNVDQTGGIYQATYDPGTGPITINLTATPISGGGLTLTGQAGTVLDGLVLIYAGTADEVIDVNVTQGIGDRVFNMMDDFLDDIDGPLALQEDNITSSNTRLQTEIDRINSQVDSFREGLLRKFSNLEAAIAKVNTLLFSLDAQSRAQQNA